MHSSNSGDAVVAYDTIRLEDVIAKDLNELGNPIVGPDRKNETGIHYDRTVDLKHFEIPGRPIPDLSDR